MRLFDKSITVCDNPNCSVNAGGEQSSTMPKKTPLLLVLVVGALMQPSLVPAQLFTNLHSFTGGGDGAVPYGGLILSGDTLYGTASGGCSGSGAVFKINTNGTEITSLHCLSGGGGDGRQPIAGLILSGNTLYGT